MAPVLTEIPNTIPLAAESEMHQVLDLMSDGSIRTFIEQIEAGHVDGSDYGGVFDAVSGVEDPASFTGCFLGWAGFLEQRSVIELGAELGWPRYALGGTDLEGFVTLIHPGHTPENDPDSAALYLLVTAYLANRQAAKDKNQEALPNVNA